MEIRRARASDCEDVQRLILTAALPTEGLRDLFPSAYWVAVHGESLIGCVGIERYGDHGLLRSLAVAESARGTSIGKALLRRALEDATGAQLASVYLLTTTAADFFLRQGFAVAERESAPVAIRKSPEFASVCPSSAACLVWRG